MDNTEEDIKDETAVVKRGRGRPKTKIEEVEPKEIKKRGPKTDKSKHKEYYAQYYRDNYQNIFVPCPNCNKPVQKCRLARHTQGKFCLNDKLSQRYMDNSSEQIN